jgi:hypothetical protein
VVRQQVLLEGIVLLWLIASDWIHFFRPPVTKHCVERGLEGLHAFYLPSSAIDPDAVA